VRSERTEVQARIRSHHEIALRRSEPLFLVLSRAEALVHGWLLLPLLRLIVIRVGLIRLRIATREARFLIARFLSLDGYDLYGAVCRDWLWHLVIGFGGHCTLLLFISLTFVLLLLVLDSGLALHLVP
jgi:hypothetical protein